MEHGSEDEHQKEEAQSDTSYSLLPTPCAKNLSDAKKDNKAMQKLGPVPFSIPPNFLIRIDECKFHSRLDSFLTAIHRR